MKILPLLSISALLALISLPANSTTNNRHKDKSLPPGIAKNMIEQVSYRRVGKKLAAGKRLDRGIYKHARVVVPLGKEGTVTVRIENKVVRLIQATREIVEILD